MNRVWDALEVNRKETAGLSREVAVLSEQIKGLREDMGSHERPCMDLKGHLEEHREINKESKRTWGKVAMAVLGPVLAGMGGALALFLGLDKLGK